LSLPLIPLLVVVDETDGVHGDDDDVGVDVDVRLLACSAHDGGRPRYHQTISHHHIDYQLLMELI
jgi:hypothetical protein